MARLDSFLRLVSEQQASDLHFHAGKVPMIRHDGELLPLPFRTLTDLEARRLLYEVLTPPQREALDAERQVDFLYVVPEVGRFRANVFLQSQGLGAVFRVIPQRTPTLSDLLFPPVVKRLTEHQNGLVLVTGPTGSGKTTTLAAMINEINRSSQRHIVTIEDPIEFVHEPVQSVVTHREVGRHVESFAAGLRSALREAADVVVVGELRDLETVLLALQAAETGLLVLGTLHTNSAAKAVDRIIDVVPDDNRDQARGVLSVVLRGIIAQHLARRAGGEGRVAVLEILVHSHGIAHLIRENKTHQIEAQIQSALGEGPGTQSLDSALYRAVRDGLVDAEEALRLANYPEILQRSLAQLGEDE